LCQTLGEFPVALDGKAELRSSLRSFLLDLSLNLIHHLRRDRLPVSGYLHGCPPLRLVSISTPKTSATRAFARKGGIQEPLFFNRLQNAARIYPTLLFIFLVCEFLFQDIGRARWEADWRIDYSTVTVDSKDVSDQQASSILISALQAASLA